MPNRLAHKQRTAATLISLFARVRGRTKEVDNAPFRSSSIAALCEINPCFLVWLLRYYAVCVIFVFGLLILIPPARAQVSREYQLKAVLLLRLAQFTQWPGDAFESPESPIVICVLGENPFGDALEAAVRGEMAHGRGLVARHQRAVDQIKDCHMLFTSAAGPRQAKEIMAALAGRSVLTVADGNGLPSAYQAMVRFVAEQNKIKLLVNPKATAANRLALDPRLLRVAEIVGQD